MASLGVVPRRLSTSDDGSFFIYYGKLVIEIDSDGDLAYELNGEIKDVFVDDVFVVLPGLIKRALNT